MGTEPSPQPIQRNSAQVARVSWDQFSIPDAGDVLPTSRGL